MALELLENNDKGLCEESNWRKQVYFQITLPTIANTPAIGFKYKENKLFTCMIFYILVIKLKLSIVFQLLTVSRGGETIWKKKKQKRKTIGPKKQTIWWSHEWLSWTAGEPTVNHFCSQLRILSRIY